MNQQGFSLTSLFNFDQSIINQYETFFSCAQDIINKNQILFNKTQQIPITFLLSDSLQIRQSALRRWKFSLKSFQSSQNESSFNKNQLNILSNSNPVLHVTFTNNPSLAFQLGMFDMFLFSLCEQHIISTESGFGRIPAFASLKQINIYSFLLNQKYSCLKQGIQLSLSGHQWSSI